MVLIMSRTFIGYTQLYRQAYQYASALVKKISLQDVIGVVGLALIVAGVACWSTAAAMILAGAVLFVFAYVTAR
jgi:ABC-type lipoprotein release transport system permease subunit